MSCPDVPDLAIGEVDVGGELAARLLRAYLEELDERFEDPLDVESALAGRTEILAPPAGTFFVATSKATAVACGGLTWLDEDTAEVRRMWVDPTWRKRGLGQWLLRQLEAVAWAKGCARVVLDTSASLPEAISLYRSCGYVEIAPYNENRAADLWFERRRPPSR